MIVNSNQEVPNPGLLIALTIVCPWSSVVVVGIVGDGSAGAVLARAGVLLTQGLALWSRGPVGGVHRRLRGLRRRLGRR